MQVLTKQRVIARSTLSDLRYRTKHTTRSVKAPPRVPIAVAALCFGSAVSCIEKFKRIAAADRILEASDT